MIASEIVGSNMFLDGEESNYGLFQGPVLNTDHCSWVVLRRLGHEKA